jgi:hypothetical protein
MVLTLPSKNHITGFARSLDRGQAARFSKGDVWPPPLLTLIFPLLTKSVILCFFRRRQDVKAIGSEAGVIAETVHAIVDFDENKCSDEQTGSGKDFLGLRLRGE